MKVQRSPFFAFKNSAIKVAVGRESDVVLIEKTEYEKYCRQESHVEYGGYFSESLIYLCIPSTGEWIVLVDTKPSTNQIDLIAAL